MPSTPIKRLWPFYHVSVSAERIELGVTESRRVIVAPPSPAIVGILNRLTGSYSVQTIATEVGCATDEVREVLSALEAAGALQASWTDDERFARHLLFYSLFVDDASEVQSKLAAGSVLLIGLGGLGCVIATQLVMAGVGAITLLDGDAVEESNLTRQFLFATSDIGRQKAEVGAERLRGLNPKTKVTSRPLGFSIPPTESEVEAVRSADLVILTADMPVELASVLNALCVDKGVSWIQAGYAETIGVVGPLVVPGVSACLRCVELAHEGEPAWTRVPHFVAPSFGPFNGVIGSLAATEAIRALTGYQAPESFGARIRIDAIHYAIDVREYSRRAECPSCGELAVRLAAAPGSPDALAASPSVPT